MPSITQISWSSSDFFSKMKIFTSLWSTWMVEHCSTTLTKSTILESNKLLSIWEISLKPLFICTKSQSPIETLNHKILSFRLKVLPNCAILVGLLLFRHRERHIVEPLITPLLKSWKEKIMICQLMFGALVFLHTSF